MKFLEEAVTYDEARELTHLYRIMTKSLPDNTIIYYIKEYEVKRSFNAYVGDMTKDNPLIIQLWDNLGHRKVESAFTYNGGSATQDVDIIANTSQIDIYHENSLSKDRRFEMGDNVGGDGFIGFLITAESKDNVIGTTGGGMYYKANYYDVGNSDRMIPDLGTVNTLITAEGDLYLPLAGGTMSGDIVMDSNYIYGQSTDEWILFSSDKVI